MTRYSCARICFVSVLGVSLLWCGGCQTFQQVWDDMVNPGNSNDLLASAGDTTIFNGIDLDQEVDTTPELHVNNDMEPVYLCIEIDRQETVIGVNTLDPGQADDVVIEEIRKSVSGIVVRNAMQSRIRELRPTIQLVSDRGAADRCDMYAEVAVINVSYNASSESSAGSGASSKHGGSAQSTTNAEYMDVVVRVRFFDHSNDQIVAIGHGRAMLEAKSGSKGIWGRSGKNSGGGQTRNLQSSILSGAITQRLIGRATSAAIIEALEDVDDFSKHKAEQYVSSTDET